MSRLLQAAALAVLASVTVLGCEGVTSPRMSSPQLECGEPARDTAIWLPVSGLPVEGGGAAASSPEPLPQGEVYRSPCVFVAAVVP